MARFTEKQTALLFALKLLADGVKTERVDFKAYSAGAIRGCLKIIIPYKHRTGDLINLYVTGGSGPMRRVEHTVGWRMGAEVSTDIEDVRELLSTLKKEARQRDKECDARARAAFEKDQKRKATLAAKRHGRLDKMAADYGVTRNQLDRLYESFTLLKPVAKEQAVIAALQWHKTYMRK